MLIRITGVAGQDLEAGHHFYERKSQGAYYTSLTAL